MLTINVKTKAIENKHEHPTVWVDSPVFGRMDQTPGYVRGWLPPNYQVPAKLDLPSSFIAALWLTPMSSYRERKVRKWYLALCFDAKGHYLG